MSMKFHLEVGEARTRKTWYWGVYALISCKPNNNEDDDYMMWRILVIDSDDPGEKIGRVEEVSQSWLGEWTLAA